MSEVSKFRCMVYGCTIPAGIFHEHPADAPVMRDPSGPLDAFERAELIALRREAALRFHAQQQQRQSMAFQQAQAMQNAWPFGSAQQFPDNATGQAHAADQLADAIRYGFSFHQDGRHVPIKDVYVVPEDAKIHGGRKLTQALLDAGQLTYEHNKARAGTICTQLAIDVMKDLDAGRPHREGADVGVVLHQAPEPRRSFVSLTARIAFWIVLAVTVAIWIFAGVKS
tara:strand:+ start:27222 stop:27899 length:678 start_codon:yes stop_codon:yes gene_type:complete